MLLTSLLLSRGRAAVERPHRAPLSNAESRATGRPPLSTRSPSPIPQSSAATTALGTKLSVAGRHSASRRCTQGGALQVSSLSAGCWVCCVRSGHRCASRADTSYAAFGVAAVSILICGLYSAWSFSSASLEAVNCACRLFCTPSCRASSLAIALHTRTRAEERE